MIFITILCVIWIFSTGAIPMTNSIDESCVVSLTIPKDAIKSNCNMGDKMLRKMQSMEAQFDRLRTTVRALEMRLPQIATQQIQNKESMTTLELNMAKTGTYVKRLEDRILALEAGKQGHRSHKSQDALLDPIRPLVVYELQKFKNEFLKTVQDNVVSKLLDPSHEIGSSFKRNLIKGLKKQVKPRILSDDNDIESSSEVDETDEKSKTLEDKSLGNRDSHTTLPNVEMDILSRSLKNISGSMWNQNTNFTEEKNNSLYMNVTNIINDTSDDVNRNSQLLKFLSVINNQITELVNDKVSQVDEKCENLNIDMTIKVKKLQNLISDIKSKSDEHNVNLTQTMNNIKTDMQKLSRKIDEPANKLYMETLTDTKIDSKISSLQKSLTGKLMNEMNTVSEKIESQNRKLNMSVGLVNIFKQTLIKYQNQTKRTMNQLQQKIAEFGVELMKKRSDNSDKLQERLNYLDEEIQVVADSQLFSEQALDTFKKRATENDREAQSQIQKLIRQVRSLEYEIQGIDQIKVTIGNQDILLNATSDKINTFKKQISELQKSFMQLKVGYLSESQWIQYDFSHYSMRNNCTGKKYIKRNSFGSSVVKYVGVQLCSATRYKILLGKSPNSQFYDVGDTRGNGEDHCQFVGATNHDESNYRVDKVFAFLNGVKGYVRDSWDKLPVFGSLSVLRPTSSWYECGISIP